LRSLAFPLAFQCSIYNCFINLYLLFWSSLLLYLYNWVFIYPFKFSSRCFSVFPFLAIKKIIPILIVSGDIHVWIRLAEYISSFDWEIIITYIFCVHPILIWKHLLLKSLVLWIDIKEVIVLREQWETLLVIKCFGFVYRVCHPLCACINQSILMKYFPFPIKSCLIGWMTYCNESLFGKLRRYVSIDGFITQYLLVERILSILVIGWTICSSVLLIFLRKVLLTLHLLQFILIIVLAGISSCGSWLIIATWCRSLANWRLFLSYWALILLLNLWSDELFVLIEYNFRWYHINILQFFAFVCEYPSFILPVLAVACIKFSLFLSLVNCAWVDVSFWLLGGAILILGRKEDLFEWLPICYILNRFFFSLISVELLLLVVLFL
jgi:hypothetical protein